LSDHEVRLYQPNDDEGIVELLVNVFGTWPDFDITCSPLDHWRWKYKDNPLTQKGMITKPIIAVTVSGKEIIGCAHTLPFRVKIGKKYFRCSHGGDLALHSDYRGRKISSKMRALRDETRRREGIVLNLGGGTVSPIVRGRNIRDGVPDFPHQHINYVKIWDVDHHLQHFPAGRNTVIKMGYHVLNMINTMSNTFRRKESARTPFNIADITIFDSSFEDFWKKIEPHYQFIVERTTDYLNWRYCDIRGGKYLITAAFEEKKALGYIVLRINRKKTNYPIGWIVDCLIIPERLDVLDALITNALDLFRTQNVNIVQVLGLKNHLYEQVYKHRGFIDGRSKSVKNYREISPMGEELHVFLNTPVNRVHSVHGDFDYI